MSQDTARAEGRRVAEAAAAESCAAVLGEIGALLRRFVIMTPAQARVVALWVVHTHLLDAAEATPYLAITSAEKRSGKTRLLEILDLLVASPWFTGRTTAAVLPRKIDADSPTLLLDESDAAFKGDKEYAEALRGVLNTGYRRGGKSTVCVGQGNGITFRDFSTFSCKAIAGIGSLPSTVADRAVPIRLDRRAPGEQIDRFRRREVEPQAEQLRHRLRALADVSVELLRDARPDLPPELDDRAWDCVEPLLAIAELAGGSHPAETRAAFVELYGGRQVEDESVGVQLLADIQNVLGDDDRITSADLLYRLNDLEESPWCEWFGKALTSRGLHKLLDRYRIKSRNIKVGDRRPKGFLREQFDSAWKRYLPPSRADQTLLRYNPHSNAENGGFQSATPAPLVADRNRADSAPQAEGSGVADSDPSGDGERGCATHLADPVRGCRYCAAEVRP